MASVVEYCHWRYRRRHIPHCCWYREQRWFRLGFYKRLLFPVCCSYFLCKKLLTCLSIESVFTPCSIRWTPVLGLPQLRTLLPHPINYGAGVTSKVLCLKFKDSLGIPHACVTIYTYFFYLYPVLVFLSFPSDSMFLTLNWNFMQRNISV